MGMATGRRGGPVALPNMTPMIDVLLVLLIIFMVVQQGLQRGVAVQVPPADPDLTTGPEALVLEVGPGGTYRLNSQPVPAASLGATLAGVFAPRARKVLFVKGEEGAAYAEVVHAVDVSRSAGVEVVGLVPRAQAH